MESTIPAEVDGKEDFGRAARTIVPKTAMLSLADLQPETFEPLVGTAFAVTAADLTGSTTLTLTTVKRLSVSYTGQGRVAFSLTFTGVPGQLLAQRMYCFDHPATGTQEFLITQLDLDPQGSRFEAIFT